LNPKFFVVYDDRMSLYDVPPSYSFTGRRFKVFVEYLRESLPEDEFALVKPRKATRRELLSVHREEYLDFVEELANEVPGSFTTYLSPDTQVNREMLEANKVIVGAAMKAVDLAMSRSRPAVTFGGLHHAGPSRGGGFCVLNDVAAAARRARSNGAKRVMILDTDAHAGDGTMDIFYSDPNVLTISVHHDPTTFYPGRGFVHEIGDGEGRGYCVNFPLPPKAGIRSYEVFKSQILEPLSLEFKPDVIIRNGGSDPYVGDIQHLGYSTFLGLAKRDFHTLGGWIKELRDRLGSSYVDIMGSGYDEDAIPSCWFSLLTGVMGLPYRPKDETLPQEVDSERVLSQTMKVAERLRELLSPYWESLS